MNLANYITNGKPCSNYFLSLIFGLVSLIFAGVIYLLSAHLLQTPEMVQLLEAIPTLEIENGQVVTPKDLVFEKKIPFSDSYILIDTAKEDATQTVASGVMLTKRYVFLSWENQVQQYQLPTEKTTVNPDFLKKLLKQGAQNMSIVIAITLFILLWLGFILTGLFIYLLSLMIRKTKEKEMIKRSALIGWFSLMILNLILLCFGYTVSFIVAVPAAAAIGLFCLFNCEASQ